MKEFRSHSLIIITLLLLSSCGTAKLERKLDKSLHRESQTHFVGLMLFDPETRDTIFRLNEDLYFTPASNVKIFTLYAGLKMLGDSLPLFRYSEEADTIRLIGTGNPLLLHPYFRDSTAIKLASQYKTVELALDNFEDDKYAPGWAWEDYPYYFSPERSGFPIYGNVVSIKNDDGLDVRPQYFSNTTSYATKTDRAYSSNNFTYDKSRNNDVFIPFTTDTLTIKNLMEYELGKPVNLISNPNSAFSKIVYSDIPVDSLYQRMMHESDNFLAEQILVMCSSTLSDTLNTQTVRRELMAKHLTTLRKKPRWVDGSGLSRYNLFSPSSMVHVLDELYRTYPEQRLFNLFPAGGRDGTLKNWYKGNTKPFIFAKSGTLGNNYNLSGYLVTNSGKVLIFSFMNNHFLNRTDSIKTKMQEILELIRDTY